MVISLIGETDTRPILYTLMKLCQSLGDVCVISKYNRILRISDSGETGGFYQNCMIAYTEEGIDEFLKTFGYTFGDFNFVILDNIIAGEADINIHVCGMNPSEEELEQLSYIDTDVVVFNAYNKKYTAGVFTAVEKFEAYTIMNQINPGISGFVASVLAPKLKLPADNLTKLMAVENPLPATKKGNKPKSLLSKFKKKG